jgi:transcriptional antiterminator RfaH
VSDGLHWYVVQTNAGKERVVRERIADLGREVFLPLISERVSGSRSRRLVPMFPRYLFARLSLDVGDGPRIRWMPGVHRLLGDAAGPRPIDEAAVRCIRTRVDRSGRVRLGRGLRRGDRVRVVEGPLAGLLGILERPIDSAGERVAVLLDVFHRQTRVVLPAYAVWGEVAS